MKTKITILLTALLMLVGISVNAQVKNQTPKRAETTTPIKGDVNEDGVVDIADINAVIEIMKNGGGTSGETKYYWYVGGIQPTSVNDNSEWKTSATDAPFNTTAYVTPGGEGYVWCAFPESWNYDITDSSGFSVNFGFVPENIKTSINGYIIYRVIQSESDTWTFQFTKK